ncbi:hypothetical protein [Streptomyces sp. NPDC047981]|uniref:hypothetical protein n=1 Tax=Streptomyces sp. NPDC047981 TaxID=3154610 RepID=UPI00342C7137
MDHPAVIALYGFVALCAGFCVAESIHHRRRARPPSPAFRLLNAVDERDLAAFRAQIEHHDTSNAVIAAATAIVDTELARTRDPKEGGPTP